MPNLKVNYHRLSQAIKYYRRQFFLAFRFKKITRDNSIIAALKIFSLLVLLTTNSLTVAGSLEQAKRIHDRLTGVQPSEDILITMKNMIDADGDGERAALYAIDNDVNDDFYNVTLKNWVAPWTNRDANVFVSLNDYIATVVGAVRDEIDFREAFYGDILYIANTELSLTPYAINNNTHYQELEAGLERNGEQGYSLKDDLQRVTQSSVTGLPVQAVAGVVTSRAAAKSFFIAGTNRANFRFTLLNHLCMDLEQVHDITLPPDRIRQDVSRSPGGDARVFLNTCIGCHTGMDPLTQAFAYHNFAYDAETDLTGENGAIEYIGMAAADAETGFPPVQPKYLFNAATFPNGYVTINDHWDNYWRTGQNAALGWDANLSGSGVGASSMVQELVHSEAFASCQVNKVFQAVCLRAPHDQADIDKIHGSNGLIAAFKSSNYNIKATFAHAADYCKGE